MWPHREHDLNIYFKAPLKKQAKFNKFVQEMKEVVTITLEPVPAESYQQTSTTELYTLRFVSQQSESL